MSGALPPPLSIVIPTLNEASGLAAFLQSLQPMRDRGVELILTDGGSNDRTTQLAAPLVDRVITAAKGRAVQMNAGARLATGDVLLFLHADCVPPENADLLIAKGLQACGRKWGRFDVTLSGHAAMLRVVAWMMNQRSRLTGICTGDQGMFVLRPLFMDIGGFPEIALMEDIAFSRMLKQHSPPLCLPQKVAASSRRWEKHGIWRTMVTMWRLRLAYAFGAEPGRLAEVYYGRKE